MGFMDKFKETADKFGGAVEKGVKTGSDKYKKMTEKSRVKKEISGLEADITEIYAEIGKQYAESNPDSAEFAEFYKDIADKNAKLDNLRAQLLDLEDRLICESCGASVAKDAKFCHKCGAKIELPVLTPEAPEDAVKETPDTEAADSSDTAE
ncbi:MAG: zinc-ribbon domain-containing protein [Ruminococcus sp.]|nr:zinc-ribbon domain-containing protein [Ruminococcus sp.]